jgi:hypothetical protein
MTSSGRHTTTGVENVTTTGTVVYLQPDPDKTGWIRMRYYSPAPFTQHQYKSTDQGQVADSCSGLISWDHPVSEVVAVFCRQMAQYLLIYIISPIFPHFGIGHMLKDRIKQYAGLINKNLV